MSSSAHPALLTRTSPVQQTIGKTPIKAIRKDLANSLTPSEELSLFSLTQNRETVTGVAYRVYHEIAKEFQMRPVTPRMFSNHIKKLRSLGLVETKPLSFGYGRGRTTAIRLRFEPSKRFIRALLQDMLKWTRFAERAEALREDTPKLTASHWKHLHKLHSNHQHKVLPQSGLGLWSLLAIMSLKRGLPYRGYSPIEIVGNIKSSGVPPSEAELDIINETCAKHGLDFEDVPVGARVAGRSRPKFIHPSRLGKKYHMLIDAKPFPKNDGG